MAYCTIYVCDCCGRPPNGNSPDCVYSHESYPEHCDCDKHDLCNECMSRQRRKLKDGKTVFKCMECEHRHRYGLPDPVTAHELISEMLVYVDYAYESAFPDDKANRDLYSKAKEWLEHHK